MDSAAVIGADSQANNALDKSALEQRYMRLLELRIAQLEAVVDQKEAKMANSADQQPAPDKEGPTVNGADKGTESDAAPKTDKAEAQVSGDDIAKGKNGEESIPPSRVKEVIATWNESTFVYDETEKSNDDENAEATNKSDKAKSGAIFVSPKSSAASHTKSTGADLHAGRIFFGASRSTATSGIDDGTILRPRRVKEDGKTRYEEIELTSPALQRLFLRTCLTRAPPGDEKSFGSSTILIRSPFVDFIWFWNELESACHSVENDSEEEAVARGDLKQVMGLIRKSTVEPYFKVREAFLAEGSSHTIPYEYLWTLYRPGTFVYAKSYLDEWQMFEVINCSRISTDSGSFESREPAKFNNNKFLVTAAAFDWDGSKFYVFEYDFWIRRDAKKDDLPIHAREVFPCKYYRTETGEHDDKKLSADLIQRGRKFWRFCNIESDDIQCTYGGSLLTSSASGAMGSQFTGDRQDEDDGKSITLTDSDEDGVPNFRKTEYAGHAVADAGSYLRSQPWIGPEPPLGRLRTDVWTGADLECQCAICADSILFKWCSFLLEKSENSYQEFAQNERRLMMCPPRVLGYALNVKTWAQFQVSGLEPNNGKFDERSTYFDEQLQLHHTYKELLLASVNNHESSRRRQLSRHADTEGNVPNSLDVIEGKGKGLAILLHGPPGVGKTLTAETIALATGRLLLVVSVAEIGTIASKAEARLNAILANATRWRAVLLVDEADVFLEERARNDSANRNALVSVLLRCLEYYEGIIILTTNRVRSIDIAVQSRMHLAIQYKNLQPSQKLAIYKNLLNKVPDSKIRGSREDLYERIEESFCNRNTMNGRQIRNIVTTALALAQSDNGGSEKLTYQHLKRVFETTTDFLESLKDLTKATRERNEAVDI